MQAEQMKSIVQHLEKLELTMTERIFTQQTIPSPAQAKYPTFLHQSSLPILIRPGQPGQAYAPVAHQAASSPGLSAPGQGYTISPLAHHGPPSSTPQGRAVYTSDFALFSCPHKMAYRQLQHTAISHQMSNLQGSENHLTRKH